jgi:hypothetical protein
MKFMLMMHSTQDVGCDSIAAWPPADVKAHIEFMIDFAKRLAAAGELVMAEGLDFPPQAKVVKFQKGRTPIVSDGPFPETKEFLAGFWIVDVPTPQRALDIAAAASAAPGRGGVRSASRSKCAK